MGIVIAGDDEIGSIAEGKRADLVLVDRDVLTVPVAEVKDDKVLWTMFGGRIVYGARDRSGPCCAPAGGRCREAPLSVDLRHQHVLRVRPEACAGSATSR